MKKGIFLIPAIVFLFGCSSTTPTELKKIVAKAGDSNLSCGAINNERITLLKEIQTRKKAFEEAQNDAKTAKESTDMTNALIPGVMNEGNANVAALAIMMNAFDTNSAEIDKREVEIKNKNSANRIKHLNKLYKKQCS